MTFVPTKNTKMLDGNMQLFIIQKQNGVGTDTKVEVKQKHVQNTLQKAN